MSRDAQFQSEVSHLLSVSRTTSRVAGSRLAPLVAHVLYRFDVGGLENGVVNLVNSIPSESYRHVIISLTDHTDFRFRIRRPDVSYYALHKRPGKDLGSYWRLWRLLRQLRPQIVHTRNLPALDFQVAAVLAGVRGRIHGEHGRDMIDLDGSSWKYNTLRRILRPLVRRYIPLSRDLEEWLQTTIGVPPAKIVRIYNGVDTALFHPAPTRVKLPEPIFSSPGTFVIGTVGRLQTVKDQLTLVRAFLHLLNSFPGARQKLRLVLIGDGPLRQEAANLLSAAGVSELAWLAGSRDDVPTLLRGLDVFVLPSLAEGISNTILEAMASGLPVIATRVGGNPELVDEGKTGLLVPASEPETLAKSLEVYLRDPALARRHGRVGRERVEREFSLPTMVQRYATLYDEVLSETLNK